MTVVSVAYYRVRTGDQTTAASAVEEALEDAESITQHWLGRILQYGEHTERLKVWPREGFVYPAAVPVASVQASASYDVYDEASIRNVSPDDDVFPNFLRANVMDDYNQGIGGNIGSGYETYYPYGTVTYHGGWTEETMPVILKRYICKVARALITGKPEGGPGAAGATMLRVGDVQVSYPKETIAGMLNQFAPGMVAAIASLKLDRL